jgi:hypothetical protein
MDDVFALGFEGAGTDKHVERGFGADPRHSFS